MLSGDKVQPSGRQLTPQGLPHAGLQCGCLLLSESCSHGLQINIPPCRLLPAAAIHKIDSQCLSAVAVCRGQHNISRLIEAASA